MTTKFNPEVLPSMTLDELREYQSPDRLRARITELEAALRAAQEHLEYCGYGDSWERECADASGLPALIDAALNATEKGS